MRTFIIIAALAASGCASTQTVLNRAPIDVVHSARSVEDVVFCMQNKLDLAPLEQAGAKVFISKTSIGVVGETISIRPEGTGSVIELRNGSTLAHGYLRKCYPPLP